MPIATEPLYIPVILGTVRQKRRSEQAARWLHARLEQRENVETRLFDIRDMDLPMDDEGQILKDKNTEYRDMILQADGLVIVSPEYNHGYPGSLKRALDILLPEYKHRAVGICGVSTSMMGGVRMVEQLLAVMRELGLVTISPNVYVPNVKDFFQEDGMPVDPEASERADTFFDELVWMASALRWGRDNLRVG